MGRIRVGGWGEGARFPSRHFLVWTVGDSKARLWRGLKPGTRTCWGKHKGADKKGVGRPAGATTWSGLVPRESESRAAGDGYELHPERLKSDSKSFPSIHCTPLLLTSWPSFPRPRTNEVGDRTILTTFQLSSSDSLQILFLWALGSLLEWNHHHKECQAAATYEIDDITRLQNEEREREPRNTAQGHTAAEPGSSAAPVQNANSPPTGLSHLHSPLLK
ncbi:uncharacterized protein LOC114213779 isoform X2 [Eumetopias jubatus]|uniref:uncharacterized protein LOC114213779 isoform X2 n=1 Tax=Eumetopias jubatus TaxID=34886 RepID=UPI001016CA53|nr:uncharacterized protein LOC114213779 isoform X2 [Eumetopias jubatus]